MADMFTELDRALRRRPATGITARVQVVRHISECDVEPITGPMSYDAGVEYLRTILDTAPNLLDGYDLIYTDTGRYASWAI